MTISRRHGWLKELERLSPAVAALGLCTQLPDDDYSSSSSSPNPDALNFASSSEHVEAMARCFELLAAHGVPAATLTKFVADLTGRNVYGSFCELSVYLWLLENKVPFDLQVPLTGADVLNPNGSDLDGRLKLTPEVFFDTKGFGFREHLINRLRARLTRDIPNKFVAIEGSFDASIADLSDMLGLTYQALRAELAAKSHAKRGAIDFTLRPPAPVQTTVNTSDPYELAEANASYAFSYAKQFVRHSPFILIFVVHPWFSGTWLHADFGNYIRDFHRAFARRTFLQHRKDKSPLFNITKGAAAGLLSGVAFFDAWHGKLESDPQVERDRARRLKLFLNPLATNPVSELALDELRWGFNGSHGIEVVRFDHDVY